MVHTKQQRFQARYFAKRLNKSDVVLHTPLSKHKEETYEDLLSDKSWLCESGKKYKKIVPGFCYASPGLTQIEERAQAIMSKIRSMTLREVNLPLFQCELATFSHHAKQRLHSVMQHRLVKTKKRLELGMLLPETWCLLIHQLRDQNCTFTHTKRVQKKYVLDKYLSMPLDVLRFEGYHFPTFGHKHWWRLVYKRDMVWIMVEIKRLNLTYDPHSHVVAASFTYATYKRMPENAVMGVKRPHWSYC